MNNQFNSAPLDEIKILREKSMREVITTGSLREIWISSQQGAAASCAYNESFTIRLHGNVNRELLLDALLRVTARHDALAVTFSDNGTVIRRQQFPSVSIPNHDIRTSSEEERIVYVNKLTEREVTTPFDLENGPLWRAHLVVHSDFDTDLIFTAHHLVCDGWSINILVREIGLFYNELGTGQAVNIKAPASFFDFVNDFNESTDTKRQKTVVDFWKNRFTPPLPVLDLPVDHIRPPRRTYNANSKRCIIDPDIVKKVAAAEGCNPFSYLLGAYATLMYKLSGSEDIVIGVPVAGQSYYTNPTVVGHCVTMLPVRIAISPDTPFKEFAATLQDELFDAYDHHELTFGDLIRELNIPRDPARIPLVPVGFTYAKMHAPGEFGFDGLVAGYSINSRHYETFEVYATVIDSKDEWELLWHFNSDLFDHSTAERWLEEYKVLLEGIADNAQHTVSKLPVLTESERTAIFEKWNATDRPFDLNDTVVSMFERQVKLSPKAVALEFRGKSISYQELNDKADILAAHLRKQGAGPDIPIGLCLNRSFDMVSSLLGILKAGAAYIPIDPSFPDDRIAFILNDANARVFITSPDISERFPDLGIPAINPENIPDVQDTHTGQDAEGKHCAYIIYTSGSTGKPKGVEIRHFSLANFLISMRETPGMNENDSLLAVTTISFDIAGLELLCPLTCGAKVYLAEKELSSDAIRLAEFITQKKPSIMQATPATWTMLLDTGWEKAGGMKILCGGEAMTRTLANRLLATGTEVWNMYGPTETTVWSAVWRVVPGDKSPPIGQPIANTRLRILDKGMAPVPLGAAGELYISGIGLARGYRNRQDLTTEKFIGDPFGSYLYSSVEKRIYKTGDIARRFADGTIEVLGRSDFQVKIRGYRIEPGEIEAALSNLPLVKECVVIDSEDVKGNKILIAYIVFNEKSSASFDELRAALRHSLPEYMIPAKFIQIESIPRLTNNKIDRKSLPKPAKESIRVDSDFAAPNTPTEHFLAAVWQEVLGVDKISIDDIFFDIGGHSLLAVQIFIRIKKNTGFDLPLATLFSSPTIRKLAITIDELRDITPIEVIDKNFVTEKKEHWKHIVPIRPQGNRIPFFCIHGVGGNVLHYKQMVKYLDQNQPIYGIQCRGLDGIEKPFSSIHEMATTYISEIKQIQPFGPYILGGGSMGGVAAFEVAQQLLKSGDKIEKLIMFDSICPRGLDYSANSKQIDKLIEPHCKEQKKVSFLQKIVHGIWCRLRDNVRMRICDIYHLSQAPIPHELRFWMIAQKNIAITEQYVPAPYPGKITLFRAQQNYGCTDPYRGWRKVAKGGIAFFDFPCTHENTIEHEDLQKKLGQVLHEV